MRLLQKKVKPEAVGKLGEFFERKKGDSQEWH